jgi:imidazolonepropionase-like amidohydrolase
MKGIVATAVLLLCGSLTVAETPQLVQDVRLFDGERVHENRSVLIEDGVIARIGGPKMVVEGAEVIDGRGRTLLPGLIDAHVHIAEDVQGVGRQALRLGITTQLDMSNWGERLKRIKRLQSEDPPDVAALRTAGHVATRPGGHPTQMMPGVTIPTLDSPSDARQFVDARLSEGADYIKIIYDDGRVWLKEGRLPMLDRATLEAVVKAAHERRKLAVVHIGTEAQARDAIAAGADGLVHMFAEETSSPDFGRFAAEHDVFVVPTLTTIHNTCGRTEAPTILADPHLGPRIDESWRRMMEMVKADPEKHPRCRGTADAMRQLIRAGVPILAGTDAPVPGNTYGASLHGELALLVEAGMTPRQALAAATSVPAKHFRLRDRGRIRRGLRADLLLVNGDPTTAILATRDIVAVWKRGVRVRATAVAAPL